MNFSIGIYSCPMDPMDSIGTTFDPLIQHERNFSKSLTNRKWTFPSESIRVQWIRWTPSERLSTPSSNMSGIFLRIHLVGLYTSRLPVFRWKARGYDWILVDSIGQPAKNYGVYCCIANTATSRRSPSLGIVPTRRRGAMWVGCI